MKNFLEFEMIVNEKFDSDTAKNSAYNRIREYSYSLPENYSDLIMEIIEASIDASKITVLNILRDYNEWSNDF